MKGLTPLIASQSSAAAHRNTQHKRNEERTERRFTRHIAQYTQRHSRPAPGIYRALDKIDRYFHSIGDFRNGRFWLWNGVHALVMVNLSSISINRSDGGSFLDNIVFDSMRPR